MNRLRLIKRLELPSGHRHLLTLQDYSPREILMIINRAVQIKHSEIDVNYRPFQGKRLAMVFSKKSTRTRVSAESGWAQFGGHSMFLGQQDIQLGAGESIRDTATVVSSMTDCVLARVGDHSEIEAFRKYSSVPVVNALSAKFHPLQILADLMTMYEESSLDLSVLSRKKVCWIGDANNILNSLLVTLPRLGIRMSVAIPKNYSISPDVLNINGSSSARVTVCNDPNEAVVGADFVITDTWISMGQEQETESRLVSFKGFQITQKLLEKANPDCKFMHCLPRKQHEVTDGVFYGEKSLVFQEALNRKFTIMAVFEMLNQ